MIEEARYNWCKVIEQCVKNYGGERYVSNTGSGGSSRNRSNRGLRSWRDSGSYHSQTEKKIINLLVWKGGEIMGWFAGGFLGTMILLDILDK